MKHLIIITYAKIIQMIRKIIMSDEILMQLIFMPGINKLRNFNSLAKAYLEFHKAKRNVPAYKQFLKEKRFNKVSFKGFKPEISEIPEIDKENYINKYNLESRCEHGELPKKDEKEELKKLYLGRPYTFDEFVKFYLNKNPATDPSKAESEAQEEWYKLT